MNVVQVKAKLTIYDVLEHFGKLPRDGSGRRPDTHSIPCPFHDDRNPSFRIYTENQSFTCFGGCGAGDVLSLIGLALDTTDFPSILGTAEAIAISRYGKRALEELLESRGQGKNRSRKTGAGRTETISGVTRKGTKHIAGSDPLHLFPLWRRNERVARARYARMLGPKKKRHRARGTTKRTDTGTGKSVRRPTQNRHSCTCSQADALCHANLITKGRAPSPYAQNLFTRVRCTLATASERRVHRDVRQSISRGAAPKDILRLYKAYELAATALMIKEKSLTRLAQRLALLAGALRRRAM